MATFVVPVEPVHASASTFANGARGHDLRFGAVLVTALTCLAFCIHGYHPYAEDGGLYLAGVERLLNPALFAHSTAFVIEPSRYSWFAASVAAIVRASHLELQTVLLSLHLASIWATLFAAWLLAGRCWPDRESRCGAVMLLSCWLTLPIAGTALSFMDPYLTARSISTPCMVLVLVGALDVTGANGSTRRHGLLLWLAAMLAAIAFHPLMAAYACAMSVVLACLRSTSRRIRILGTGGLITVFFATAAYVSLSATPESSVYRRVALTRTYWFPAMWSWYELLGLAAPIAILIFLARKKDRRSEVPAIPDAARSLYLAALAVGVCAFAIAECFAQPGAQNFIVARLQPLRIFQTVYFIMLMALGAALGKQLLRRHVGRWIMAIFLLGGPLFLADRGAFPDSPHLEASQAADHNPWVQAFRWIRDNTPQDALFALDPDYINAPGENAQCFRAIAERSSLPDYSKDGGEASIAPGLTESWTAGQQAQRGLSAPSTTDAMRVSALGPLGVTWILLDVRTPTALSCPYTNSAVSVCRLQ